MSNTYANPLSCAYLESLGLNPYEVCADGWTDTVYETVEGYDLNDDPISVWHEWPKGFDYETFIQLWWADKGRSAPKPDPLAEIRRILASDWSPDRDTSHETKYAGWIDVQRTRALRNLLGVDE